MHHTFSIPSSTFSDWTKNLNEEHESKRLSNILELHLQCETQIKISQDVGLKQNTISDKIKEIEKKINEISINPDSDLPIKYQFLQEKTLDCSFTPKLYNVWNTPINRNRRANRNN